MSRRNGTEAKKPSDVRVYNFGVPFLSDPATKEIVADQSVKFFRYRNRLVDIERARRSKFRALRRSLSPELDQLENELDTLEKERKRVRAKFLRVSRLEREGHPHAVQLQEIEDKRKDLWSAIATLRKKVEKQFFGDANAELKSRREEEKKRRKTATHTSREVNNATAEEMLNEPQWGKAWREKLQIDRQAEADALQARKDSGCYSGVYLAVDSAAKQSFATTKFQPCPVLYTDPKRIGAQLKNSKGISVQTALACTDSCLKIVLRPDIHLRKENRARRLFEEGRTNTPPRVAAEAHIKLAGRRPTEAVVIRVPFVMHRPLPSKGTIKWVYLKIEQVGARKVYQLQFTVETEREETERESQTPPAAKGVVAVRLGWQVLPKGDVRVATLFDGTKIDYITLPSKDYKDERNAEAILLGASDDTFDNVRKATLTWLKADTQRCRQVENMYLSWRKEHHLPEPEKNLIESLTKSHSHKILIYLARTLREKYLSKEEVDRLWHRWKLDRMGTVNWKVAKRRKNKGDLFSEGGRKHDNGARSFEIIHNWCSYRGGIQDPMVQMAVYLDWWVQKDKHLVNSARNVQRRIKLNRREIYRKAAANLARTYCHVVVGELDLAKLAKKTGSQQDTAKRDQAANSLRQFCGIFVLKLSLKHRFGPNYKTVPVREIPKNHYGCNGKLTQAPDELNLVCTKCGKTVEKDANTAVHLWAANEQSSA